MKAGEVDPALLAEFPELRLWTDELDAGRERTTRELRDELARLSDRFAGAQAIAMRRQPVPAAYRVFFRHIGLDPDEQRPPSEELAVERMRGGRFARNHLVADAVTVALVHTGVPLWALDAGTLSGPLVLRPARTGGEVLADGRVVPSGRLVVADAERPVAVLFGHAAPEHELSRSTRRTLLYTVQVRGVPPIHVHEAFDQVRAWVLGE